MNRLYKNILLLPALALCITLHQSVAIAQTPETPDSVKTLTLGCLFRSIAAVNKRNVKLQGLQKELEAMQPLAPQNLDSDIIASNLTQVAKYLRFLESHRQQLSMNLRIFADSVRILRSMVNQEDEKQALDHFLTAYKAESAAFTGYSQRLSLLITDIRSALTFMKTVPMTRKGNDVTFNTDKSANDKYMDFQSKLSAGQFQVDDAIARTIKLSEKENAIIQEATTVFNR
ncbi:MAG: hypothetical protein WCH46_05405 [bacterium]